VTFIFAKPHLFLVLFLRHRYGVSGTSSSTYGLAPLQCRGTSSLSFRLSYWSKTSAKTQSDVPHRNYIVEHKIYVNEVCIDDGIEIRLDPQTANWNDSIIGNDSIILRSVLYWGEQDSAHESLTKNRKLEIGVYVSVVLQVYSVDRVHTTRVPCPKSN
jgi:hypothetical protein